MSSRAYLVTRNRYGGHQRKIAWFNRRETGLYFDFPFLSTGAHTSFHKDGSIWKTALSTDMKPERTGYSYPIDSKTVWVQLGISAFRKEVAKTFPITKQSDFRKHSIYDVDLSRFPCAVLNFIVECISPEILRNMPDDLQPPDNAEAITIDEWEPYVVISIVGARARKKGSPEH